MRPFKFFQKRPIKWLESTLLGQVQWMYRPVGVIFYMDRRWNGNFYTEELKSMTITSSSRIYRSYDHFMEVNRNSIIFAYSFYTPFPNMVEYNQDNFEDMPRDTRIVFKGVIRNNENI